MIASVLIIIVSLALFVYWFRYTCLLILRAKTVRDYAPDVAAANQLTFLDLKSRLSVDEASADSNEALDQVFHSLDRDYRLVVYLLNHAANYQAVKDPLEQWLLRFDYRLMGYWYRVARFVSEPAARGALLEMTSIVGHLANTMGHKIAGAARA